MITAEAVIDLNALKHNYATLNERAANSELISVIKGDAYGHGAVNVAQALEFTHNANKIFAVSRIEEAIELREAGIKNPVLLLEGCFCRKDLELAAQQGFHTVVHHHSQLEHFGQGPLDKPIRTWLKIDSGMHRLGFQQQELDSCIAMLEQSGNIDGELGYVSHFSRADEPNSETTKQQIELFLQLTDSRNGQRTIANSAGILYWPQIHLDYVRAGIALYGISPNENEIGKQHGLMPAMTLQSKLIAVREHKAGDPVGYGEIWHSDQDTKIGVVALGYGDGYPRLAPEGTPVWLNGRIVPIVGRISMDMLTVDLSPNATDKVGDRVEFWGNNLPIEQVAKVIGTIPYELTIKLTKRVSKRYI